MPKASIKKIMINYKSRNVNSSSDFLLDQNIGSMVRLRAIQQITGTSFQPPTVLVALFKSYTKNALV